MKTRLFILCLFFIVGLASEVDAQVESIKWGENDYRDAWGFHYHKYFVGKTDEHFYYIQAPYRKNILNKFDYNQKEIYSKKLNLNFKGEKLGLYSFINSNGKTYAILRNNNLNPSMDFYVSEFKNDEFGEISQPYNSKEFKGFYTPHIYSLNLSKRKEPYTVKQNKDNGPLYHQQSGNKKYFAMIGKSGFIGGSKNKLAVVVLNEDMKIVWQKKVDLDDGDFTHIPQFHVANNGDVFVILSEEKNLSKGHATKQDNKLIHITKDSHEFIHLGLSEIDIIADLGFFNSNHGNEIYLAGIYERPDEAFIGKYHAFEGLFFFKFNTKTKEKHIQQNNVPIKTFLSINHLVKTENHGFFIKLEDRSKSFVDHHFSGDIHIYKFDEEGNKTHYKNIYHRIKINDTAKVVQSLMTFHNDKIYLVYSNNIEDSLIKGNLWKYTTVRSATLDMNLELIGNKESIYSVDELKYLFVAYYSFSHKDKIVLCNIKGANKMKFTTLNLK